MVRADGIFEKSTCETPIANVNVEIVPVELLTRLPPFMFADEIVNVPNVDNSPPNDSSVVIAEEPNT